MNRKQKLLIGIQIAIVVVAPITIEVFYRNLSDGHWFRGLYETIADKEMGWFTAWSVWTLGFAMLSCFPCLFLFLYLGGDLSLRPSPPKWREEASTLHRLFIKTFMSSPIRSMISACIGCVGGLFLAMLYRNSLVPFLLTSKYPDIKISAGPHSYWVGQSGLASFALFIVGLVLFALPAIIGFITAVLLGVRAGIINAKYDKTSEPDSWTRGYVWSIVGFVLGVAVLIAC